MGDWPGAEHEQLHWELDKMYMMLCVRGPLREDFVHWGIESMTCPAFAPRAQIRGYLTLPKPSKAVSKIMLYLQDARGHLEDKMKGPFAPPG